MFKVMLKAILFVLTFNCYMTGYAFDSSSKLDGMIANIDPKDVVSYAYLRNMPGMREKLQQSYSGLNDEAKLDQLLTRQNYVEVLNHLWSEPEGKKRLAWLEKKANLGHPILMFELGVEYVSNSPNLETYIYKTVPWIKAGYFRTVVDSKCASIDPSVDIASLLMFAYDASFMISQVSSTEEIARYCNENKKEILKATHQIILQTLKPFLSMETASKMPAPIWISSEKHLKANEWFEVQKKGIEEILQECEIAVPK